MIQTVYAAVTSNETFFLVFVLLLLLLLLLFFFFRGNGKKEHLNSATFTPRVVCRPLIGSLRSKRFQSSYGAKFRAGAKKKRVEGGGGGEKRKRLPANLTILENAPWYFKVRFICKLTVRQNRRITNRLPLHYQICKITLFYNRTRSRRLQKL